MVSKKPCLSDLEPWARELDMHEPSMNRESAPTKKSPMETRFCRDTDTQREPRFPPKEVMCDKKGRRSESPTSAPKHMELAFCAKRFCCDKSFGDDVLDLHICTERKMADRA